MSETLKPCPFCGAPAEYDSARWNGISPVHGNVGHAVYCTECPLPSSGGCPQFETKEEAFEHWNRRAPDPAALQAAAQEIRDELEAALRAKGYPRPRAQVQFGAAWTAQIACFHDGAGREVEMPVSFHSHSLTEALDKARARIAELPYRATHEDIGRTLGILPDEAA